MRWVCLRCACLRVVSFLTCFALSAAMDFFLLTLDASMTLSPSASSSLELAECDAAATGAKAGITVGTLVLEDLRPMGEGGSRRGGGEEGSHTALCAVAERTREGLQWHSGP